MKSSTLRRAFGLESEIIENNELPVVMKGPLAEVMTQALNVAYAKKDQVTGTDTIQPETVVPPEVSATPIAVTEPAGDTASLESQAQDAAMLQTLVTAASGGNESMPDQNFMTLYGVDKNNVTSQDIIEVTQQIDAVNDPQDFVLIVDATRPSTNSETSGVPQERLVDVGLAPVLESLVLTKGGRVFPSLVAFAKARKQ